MPVRMIREGILDSGAVNSLSLRGENFYRRLMSVVDDYGRFDGRVEILRARLYCLQLGSWTEKNVEAALNECVSVGLVSRYVVDNKPFVVIEKFGQTARSKPKYPDPPAIENNCTQLQTDARNCTRLSESYSESKSYSESEEEREDLRASAPITHALGEFGHVVLTDEQMHKLDSELGALLPGYIDRFDGWVHEAPNAKASGTRRKDRSAYLSIRAWYRRDKAEGKLPKRVKNHGFSEDPDTDAVAAAIRARSQGPSDRQVAEGVRGDFPDVREKSHSRASHPLLPAPLGDEPF